MLHLPLPHGRAPCSAVGVPRSTFIPVRLCSIAARCAGAAALALALAACETPRADAPPPTASIAQLYQRPAERALIQALRLYEDGAFDRAETGFRSALQQGLRDARDTAVAYKYLAFVACAFNRIGECEQGFRAALSADPEFRLNDAEVGHPIWGPVYRRVIASAPAQGRKDKPEGPGTGLPAAPSERTR
jgi:hypothetical protein